jgi:hypothetical protein
MQIVVNAEIDCSDGPCGRVTCLILRPTTPQVTHLVVAERDYPYLKRLAPVQLLRDSTPGHICLDCTKNQLATLRPFQEIEYTPDDAPYFAYEANRVWPYDTTETMPVPLQLETIPANVVLIHQHALVKATNGWVGQVSAFLVQPPNGSITHLVLRQGHLWRKKEMTIPVSEIARFENEVVYLKLDKRSLETLPAVSARR